MYLNLLISLQYLFTRATVTVHPRPLCVWYFCMSSKILWQVEMKAYDGRGDITENWTHWSILPIVPHNACHMRMTQIGGLQVLNITIDSFTTEENAACRSNVQLKNGLKLDVSGQDGSSLAAAPSFLCLWGPNDTDLVDFHCSPRLRGSSFLRRTDGEKCCRFGPWFPVLLGSKWIDGETGREVSYLSYLKLFHPFSRNIFVIPWSMSLGTHPPVPNYPHRPQPAPAQPPSCNRVLTKSATSTYFIDIRSI